MLNKLTLRKRMRCVPWCVDGVQGSHAAKKGEEQAEKLQYANHYIIKHALVWEYNRQPAPNTCVLLFAILSPRGTPAYKIIGFEFSRSNTSLVEPVRGVQDRTQ